MSCLKVINIRVQSLSIDYNQITWELEDTQQDVLDYTFQVLKSESATGSFEPASVPVEDQYTFIDNLVKAGNIYRQYHYIIRVTRKKDGEYVDYGPVAKGPEATLIATELRKHMNLLMREFIGRRCWLLPVRTFGHRCSDCWNPRLKKRRKSGCRTCFDTGFVRGYHRPVEVWASIDPHPANQQPTNLGRVQQTNTTARMAHFPPIKPNDLLIEPENNRWRVITRSTTQEQRTIVTQELQIHQVPTTDIEYTLPLDIGAPMQDLFFTPSRQYSNPQNLDIVHPNEFDFPQIYQLYPSTYPPVKT
jgi:hypothetical protein